MMVALFLGGKMLLPLLIISKCTLPWLSLTAFTEVDYATQRNHSRMLGNPHYKRSD